MKTTILTTLATAATLAVGAAQADVTFYEHQGYGGRSFSSERAIGSFERNGFNDRASAVVVSGQRWEVCEDVSFRGRCVVLQPGNYPSLERLGLNDRISSARPVAASARIDPSRYAPPPRVSYDYRPRRGERLYRADVVAVRAVVGTPQQRCWVEREQLPPQRGPANVGGAIAGAVIGGILGHQIGGGSGRDIATAGGVVAGAAVGANVNRGAQPAGSRDVQHCATVPGSARTEYWDVTYDFRGQRHQVQMTEAPGATITVNRDGEPRAAG